MPQGNLAERIRAAGAGIGGFFTPTGYGTELAKGKETREIDGRMYVLEYPIHADFALIKAERGDRWGNLDLPHDRAQLRPDHGDGGEDAPSPRCTRSSSWASSIRRRSSRPGIFVQRVVQVDRVATSAGGFRQAA